MPPSNCFIHTILILPKSLNLLTFLLISLHLLKKYMKTSEDDRYVLHRVFIFGFLSWVLYMAVDIIVFPLATQSFIDMNIQNTGTVMYYPLEYPSLFIANVLRDFGMAGGLCSAFSYLFSVFIITKGELWTWEKIVKKKWLLAIIAIGSCILIANDTLGVTVIDGAIYTEAVWSGMAGFSVFLLVLIYCGSALFLGITVLKINCKEEHFRRGFKMIAIGISFMGLGSIYWLVFGKLRGFIEMEFWMILMFYFIGHFIWSASPILIYYGLKKLWERKCPSANKHD